MTCFPASAEPHHNLVQGVQGQIAEILRKGLGSLASEFAVVMVIKVGVELLTLACSLQIVFCSASFTSSKVAEIC